MRSPIRLSGFSVVGVDMAVFLEADRERVLLTRRRNLLAVSSTRPLLLLFSSPSPLLLPESSLLLVSENCLRFVGNGKRARKRYTIVARKRYTKEF